MYSSLVHVLSCSDRGYRSYDWALPKPCTDTSRSNEGEIDFRLLLYAFSTLPISYTSAVCSIGSSYLLGDIIYKNSCHSEICFLIT